MDAAVEDSVMPAASRSSSDLINSGVDSYLSTSQSELNFSSEQELSMLQCNKYSKSFLPPVENDYRKANVGLPTLPPISISITKWGNVAFELKLGEERPVSAAAKRNCFSSHHSARNHNVRQTGAELWQNKLVTAEKKRRGIIEERVDKLKKRSKLIDERKRKSTVTS